MDIIEDNIALMRSGQEGGLALAVGAANFSPDDYPGCTTTIIPYFYDNEGRILYFGYKTSAHLREFNEHQVKVALRDYNTGTPRTRIVNYTPPAHAPAIAQRNLEQSIEEYNKQYSFTPSSEE